MAFRLTAVVLLVTVVGLIGAGVFRTESSKKGAYMSPATVLEVVDDAGQPVKNALVLLNWKVIGSDGLAKRSIQVIEALTDEEGEAQIPAWGPLPKSVGAIGYDQPHLRVFKLGFLPFLQVNKPRGGGYKAPDLISLRWSGKPIVLQRADKDDESYIRKLQMLARSLGFFRRDEDCFIASANKMVAIVNTELDRIEQEHGIFTSRITPDSACNELQTLGSYGSE